MPDQAIDRETEHNWIPTSALRRPGLSQTRTFARNSVNVLENVPVMPATLLGLEILLHEPCIDLRLASELVLSDVGATLRILSLVAKEYEFATEHLCRMGDCLASLDAGTWFEAISFDALSARTSANDYEHAAASSLWYHCRRVAQYAQLVAESLDGVSPEEAYLVGLLHEISSIPNVLGWPNENLRVEASLPLFVLSAIRSMNDPSSGSVWKFIMAAAHELAGARGDDDPRGPGTNWPAFASAANACVCAAF